MIGLAQMAWQLAWRRSFLVAKDLQPFWPSPLPRFHAEGGECGAPSCIYYRIIDAISRGEQP